MTKTANSAESSILVSIFFQGLMMSPFCCEALRWWVWSISPLVSQEIHKSYHPTINYKLLKKHILASCIFALWHVFFEANMIHHPTARVQTLHLPSPKKKKKKNGDMRGVVKSTWEKQQQKNRLEVGSSFFRVEKKSTWNQKPQINVTETQTFRNAAWPMVDPSDQEVTSQLLCPLAGRQGSRHLSVDMLEEKDELMRKKNQKPWTNKLIAYEHSYEHSLDDCPISLWTLSYAWICSSRLEIIP